MARGWESKSVEAQQEQASEKVARRSAMTAGEAAVFREKENLRLSRQSIVCRLDSALNPRHRKLLEQALAALDEKLAGL